MSEGLSYFKENLLVDIDLENKVIHIQSTLGILSGNEEIRSKRSRQKLGLGRVRFLRK